MADHKAMDLQQLRGAMKRDPPAYLDELLLQLRHFEASLQIFDSRPSKPAPEMSALATFLSHVTPCYSKELKHFPSKLVGLLEQHMMVMDPALRKALAENVIMLRNRKLLPVVGVNQLFFQMFRCKDKKLRALLASHIIQDIKDMNKGKQNNKVNRELQNFMFKMLEDRNGVAAKCSLDVLVSLYKKKVWEDAKTVNVIATACFSQEAKVRATALNFFLGLDDEQAEGVDTGGDSDEELDAGDLQALAGNKDSKGQVKQHSKRSRKRILKARRAMDKVKRKNDKEGTSKVRFAALQLLNDPQGFSEKLLAQLRKSTDKFEVKLLMMSLVSRIIATHQLLVLNFYPFVQKYMQPHQTKVTSILASAAQAVHDLVPPDAVEPLIKTLCNHFIVDGRQDEVIAIGLNTVREICSRQPLAMDKTLLEDLVQYKKHKDKGVVMAARSLISLFRNVDSEMLAKKDRGKKSENGKGKKEYGEGSFSTGVEGLDLLEMPSDSDSDMSTDEEEESSDENEGEDRRDRRKIRLGYEDRKAGDSESGEEMEEGEEGEEEEDEEEEEEDSTPKVFDKGDRIMGRWQGSEDYHPGKVIKKNPDGTLHVKFDDGDVEKKQPAEHCEFYQSDSESEGEEEEEEEEEEGEEEGAKPKVFEKGDRIMGRWQGSEDYHPGKVIKKNPDGTLHVKFDDGDVEKKQPAEHCEFYQSDSESGEEEEEEEGVEEGEEDAAEGEEAKEGGAEGDKMETEGGEGKGGAQDAGEGDLMRLDATRLLTEEEFAKIRKLKMKESVASELGKRKVESRLAPDDLVGQHKKKRQDKLDRIQGIVKGREGREGAWKDRHEKKKAAGGTRNDEKAKNKPYLMIRGSRKVRAKLKVSVAEKNKASSKAQQRKQFRGRMGGDKN